MQSYKTDKRDYVFGLKNGSWRKVFFEPAGSPRIDVRRTNSLISPYTATCEFELFEYYTAPHYSEKDARADNVPLETKKVQHRHTYAFQSGRWVVKTRQHFYAFLGSWDTCDDCWAKSMKPTTDQNGCWEPDTSYNLNSCEH